MGSEKLEESVKEKEIIKHDDKHKDKELIYNIQELDRRRIARDLHDTSLQNLTHMIHKLELASMYIDKDVIQAKLEIAAVSKNINEIIDEIRNIIFDLRPMAFDDLGLKETIKNMLDKIRKNSGIIVIEDIDEIYLDREDCLLGIFRIIQECVNNVCKHAKAKHLKVSLKNRDQDILLEVVDDGVGFDIETAKNKERHFGLFIVQERVEMLNGNFEIVSSKENGTKVIVKIPK